MIILVKRSDYIHGYYIIHENSVGLSSTTNPKPKGQPSISLPAQANLTQQKAEPLRCLALRTRGGRLKSSFVPWEHGNSPYPPKWLMDMHT